MGSSREYRKGHADEIAAYQRSWRAQNREKVNAYQRDWNRRHREQAMAMARKWAVENPEGRKAILARYHARHPEKARMHQATRRARVRGAFGEVVDSLVVLERDDGVCGICGEDVDPLRFEVDHIVPLARGGLHNYENSQPAHVACNRRKGPREGAA